MSPIPEKLMMLSNLVTSLTHQLGETIGMTIMQLVSGPLQSLL